MFERKNKYLVLKWDDIYNALTFIEQQDLLRYINHVETYRKFNGSDPSPEFVCIKSTYPEYEYVWQQIEKRVTNKELTLLKST